MIVGSPDDNVLQQYTLLARTSNCLFQDGTRTGGQQQHTLERTSCEQILHASDIDAQQHVQLVATSINMQLTIHADASSESQSQPERVDGHGNEGSRSSLQASTLHRPIFAEQPTIVRLSKRASVEPREMARLSADATHEEQVQELEGVSQDGSRMVPFNGGEAAEGHVGNKVITAKYNVVTFLPIYLFEMFSRVAYLYFLFQACLSWWRTISPFGGVGSTMALTFVLFVGAVKAILEDLKRHQEDARTNVTVAHRLLSDGTTEDMPWRDVQVGHLLVVKDDEKFPADLLCLYAALPESVCFIKTTNLDGETNLKIRKPVDLKGSIINNLADVAKLEGTTFVEQPNANLHVLRGNMQYVIDGAKRTVPVTMNEMLLRGCLLKNSKFVVGQVVYTGKETRIQKNSAKTPLKMGSFDRFLNTQILLIILMNMCMCSGCTALAVAWRHRTGEKLPHLALQYYINGNFQGFAGVVITFLTFWLLYSYLVPISLFVTMEIVKFWQGFGFMNNDPEMVDPSSGETAKARNSNLNEDLGKVEYVFSDKTGTLTSNEMQLRMIAIKGVPAGDPNWKLEANRHVTGMAALQEFDVKLAAAYKGLKSTSTWEKLLEAGGSSKEVLQSPVSNMGELGSMLGQHVLDFWTNVMVCNSLIVEDNPKNKGLPLYQGPSPDEVALVDAARQLGFEFVNRSMTHVSLSVHGRPVQHEILNSMEFTSERGRMSVIARAPDGTMRLYSKGADAKMLGRLRKTIEPSLLEEVDRSLHLFATKGLRTLLLGTKILSPAVYAEWDRRYQAAASSLDGREMRIAKLCDEIEQDLELVGITAIEDKLQDGVPQAIASLLAARIRVWMITGDKQETAINIGISCKLITRPDSLLVCNAEGEEAAANCLRQLQSKITSMEAQAQAQGGQAMAGELVIDGKTLSHVLGTPAEKLLADVGSRCNSVIICRASPSQKASIVTLMTDYEMDKASEGSYGIVRWFKRRARRQQGKMLSIGDGANDVAMIQAADIGVGIMGKEGRQAVNNSDYAIGQFRFLTRLLLVHGTLCHYRLARLIKYSFYKNIIFAFTLFFFQFFCGFSGQSLIDGIPAAVYNVFFTSLPILLFALLDRPVKHLETLIRYPQLYRTQSSLNTGIFWRAGVIAAITNAAVVFFVPFLSLTANGTGTTTDVYSLGKMLYVGLLGTISLEIIGVARFMTWLWWVAVILSYVVVFPFIVLYPRIQQIMHIYDPSWYGPPDQVLATGQFWIAMLATYTMTFGSTYFIRMWMWLHTPQDSMIISEKEKMEGNPHGGMGWQTRMRLTLLAESSQETGSESRPRARDSKVHPHDPQPADGSHGSSAGSPGWSRGHYSPGHSPVAVDQSANSMTTFIGSRLSAEQLQVQELR